MPEYNGNTIAQASIREDGSVQLQNGWMFEVVWHWPDDNFDPELSENCRWHSLDFMFVEDDGYKTSTEGLSNWHCFDENTKEWVVVVDVYDNRGTGPNIEAAVHDLNDHLESGEYTLDEFGEDDTEEPAP